MDHLIHQVCILAFMARWARKEQPDVARARGDNIHLLLKEVAKTQYHPTLVDEPEHLVIEAQMEAKHTAEAIVAELVADPAVIIADALVL